MEILEGVGWMDQWGSGGRSSTDLIPLSGPNISASMVVTSAGSPKTGAIFDTQSVQRLFVGGLTAGGDVTVAVQCFEDAAGTKAMAAPGAALALGDGSPDSVTYELDSVHPYSRIVVTWGSGASVSLSLAALSF